MVETADPLVGTLLAGRYRIERRLGMGGMGAVYVAVQDPLGRQVALKVLKPALISDPVAVERFKNEARIIASVGHPHIVAVHDFGQTDDGTLYLVMEYLQGRTLSDALKTGGPIPWARTLAIVRDVARALSAAHKRGIVHRDLKPDNIVLVDVEGVNHDYVKVLDFGIAKLVTAEAGAPNLTGTGFVPGTPGYIAPEQILGDADDARCDLYALGVTWFEMLTGKRPFNADSAMKVFLAHLNDPPPKVGDAFPLAHVPPPVEALLQELMAKAPDGRPRDADALLACIRALADQGFVPEQATETPHHGSAVAADLTPTDATMSSMATPSPTTGVRGTPSTSALPPALVPQTPSTGTSATTQKPSTAAQLHGVARRSLPTAAKVALGVVFLATVAFAGRLLWMIQNANQGASFRIPTIDDPDASYLNEQAALQDSMLQGDPAAADAKARALLATNDRQPWPHFIRGLAAAWRDDWEVRESGLRIALEKMNVDGMEETDDYAAALIRFADAASRLPPDQVEQAWAACEACRWHKFGLLAGGILLSTYAPHSPAPLEAVLEQLRKDAPVSAGAAMLRATHELRYQRVAAAVAEARAALQWSPGSSAAHLALARALVAQDGCAEALVHLRASHESGSRKATLALAEHLLLCAEPTSNVEAQRAALIAGLLANEDPATAGEVARGHGAALAGAGRPADAAKLFEDAITAAVEANLGRVAAPTMMWGEQALESAGEGDLLAALEQQSDDVGQLADMTEKQRRIFEGSRKVLAGTEALRTGNLKAAKARLQGMLSLGDQELPGAMRKAIIGHLQFPLALAEGDIPAAWRAIDAFDSACRRAALRTVLLAAHGRPEGGGSPKVVRVERPEDELEVQELRNTLLVCRTEEFANGVVLRAFVALAERAKADGRAEDFQAHLDVIDRRWPWLDRTTSVLGRRVAALTAP